MFKVLNTFMALIERDLAVFWSTFFDRCINALIWGSLTVVVFEFIMPGVGLANYGAFTAASGIASWGFFEVTENIARFVSDLEGDRSITYYLTLPLPQWAVFVRLAISNALQAMLIAIFFLPLFKLILRDSLPFADFSTGKFIIMFLLGNLFFGFFSLFLASRINRLDEMGNVWLRIVFPMWFLGCFQFSWEVLAKMSPKMAIINLLNPMVYVMEGMRAAVLGQSGSLPFWNCCGAIIIATVIIGFFSTMKLRKKLDCLR